MSSYPWCSKKWLRDPQIVEGQFFHGLCFTITIIGIIANSFLIAAMRRPKLKKQAVSILLISLAIFDTLKLITGILMIAENSILAIFEKTNTFFTSDTSCASFMFVQKFITCTAIWLVFSVIVERFTWVYFKERQIITRIVAKIFVCVIILINVLANLDYAFTTKYNEEKKRCSSRDFHQEYCEYRTEFKGIAECVWKLLPLFLNIIFTTLIIAKLWHQKRNAKRSLQRLDGKDDGSDKQLIRMTLAVCIVSTLILIPPNVNSAYGKFTERRYCAKPGSNANLSEVPSLRNVNETSFLALNGVGFNKDLSRGIANPDPLSGSRKEGNDLGTSAGNGESSPETSAGNGRSAPGSGIGSTTGAGKKGEEGETMSPGECAVSVIMTYIAGRPFFLLNHAVNFFIFIVSAAVFRREFAQMMGDCCSGSSPKVSITPASEELMETEETEESEETQEYDEL